MRERTLVIHPSVSSMFGTRVDTVHVRVRCVYEGVELT